ncbi:zinc finger protein 502-like isoform X2 [Tigriopus californicus]|uniref:zinc finger protein 502-like isoform X2 n=1 Tax=Tigriopus californicus TaxID=6832 RepID=UPI0027DA9969|nr:zinc finger protein 502-like isoform X2 [Tigriopus californicus]
MSLYKDVMPRQSAYCSEDEVNMGTKYEARIRHAHFILGSFHETKKEGDVMIKCSNGITTSHALFLASASELLRNYFVGIASTDLKDPMLILPDVSVQEFDEFADHCLVGNHFEQNQLPSVLKVLHVFQAEHGLQDWLESWIQDKEKPASIVPEEFEHLEQSTNGKLSLVSIREDSPKPKKSQDTRKPLILMKSRSLEDDSMDQVENSSELPSPVASRQSVLGTGSNQCHFCPKRYRQVKARNTHMLADHLDQCKENGLFFKCHHCDMSFTSVDGRVKHENRTHPTSKSNPVGHGSHMDERLGNRFDNIRLLSDGTSQMKCMFNHDSCEERTFENFKAFKAHWKQVHPDKDRTCFICTLECTDREALLEHIQVHQGPEGRFLPSCDSCDKKFLADHAVILHKRDDHPLKDTLYCELCGKGFKNAKFLLNHKQKHKNGLLQDYIFQCETLFDNGDVCGKTFQTQSNLQRHIRSHRNEKSFACDECGKAFVDSTRLKIHRWIHTGYTPYKCDLCDKGFRHSGHLKKHLIRDHEQTSSTKFQCLTCPKSFFYQYELRNHMNTHLRPKSTRRSKKSCPPSIETLFECEKCQKSFETFPELEVHSQNHSNLKSHPTEQRQEIVFLNATDSAQNLEANQDQFVILYEMENHT